MGMGRKERGVEIRWLEIVQADYTFSFVLKYGGSQRENNVSLITRFGSTRATPAPRCSVPFLPPPSASAPSFRSIFHPRLGRTRRPLRTHPTPAPKRGLKWCLRENQKHYRLYLLKCVVLLSLLSVLASTIFVLLISKNASFTISFPLFFFFSFPPRPPFLVDSSFLKGLVRLQFFIFFFFFSPIFLLLIFSNFSEERKKNIT